MNTAELRIALKLAMTAIEERLDIQDRLRHRKDLDKFRLGQLEAVQKWTNSIRNETGHYPETLRTKMAELIEDIENGENNRRHYGYELCLSIMGPMPKIWKDNEPSAS